MSIPAYVFCILLCIAFSAFFSATETGFSSINHTRLKALADKGNKKASLALQLADDYDKLISTILIGNNIVNIAAASLSTMLFVQLCGDIGPTVSTIVITVVVLIFGEVSPKSVAKDSPEKTAMMAAPAMNVLTRVFRPLTYLFSQWKKLLSKVLKADAKAKVSQEELLMLVEEVAQEGSIDQNESALIRNAIEFNELEAGDILTHRVDLEAVPLDATKQEVAACFAETKFSRLLVYEENIDHIVGVIHQKDFYTGSGITGKKLKDIITPAIFVLKGEKISDLLRKLQKAKSHVAVVVDEYGGTLGIVTMEDILEELVGEIWDEHDEVTHFVTQTANNDCLIDCAMDLDEFNDMFHLRVDSDMVSLGGWVMEMLGRVPQKGDQFSYANLTVTVTDVQSHHPTQVRVTVHAPVSSDEEAAPSDAENAAQSGKTL
ncbi:MAG: hemolysin family protein [Clostridiales bacterium]|nr:hemolysin family protein [Clostridiales bacterium]